MIYSLGKDIIRLDMLGEFVLQGHIKFNYLLVSLACTLAENWQKEKKYELD